MNRSYLLDIKESKAANNFNPGFYFHINMKKNTFLSTGVLVKSDVGARGMEPYLNGDLSYEKNVRDEYKYIDAGLYGGVGYKFKQETKSISLGAGYYYGLVNVSKNPDYKIKNSSIYFFVRITIIPGIKKKKKKDQ